MPREGGNADVRWFDVEPCYVFHPMNAYDDGDTIVLDVVRHPKMFDTDRPGPTRGRPHWTAGPSISPTARCANRVSTIAGRNFPASTSAWSASGIGTVMRPAASGPEGADTLLKHDFVRGSTESRSLRRRKSIGRVRVPSVIARCGRGRRRADGLCLRPVHRSQRTGDPRRANPAGHREHQAAASSARRIPRQLGTGQSIANNAGVQCTCRLASVDDRPSRRRATTRSWMCWVAEDVHDLNCGPATGSALGHRQDLTESRFLHRRRHRPFASHALSAANEGCVLPVRHVHLDTKSQSRFRPPGHGPRPR